MKNISRFVLLFGLMVSLATTITSAQDKKQDKKKDDKAEFAKWLKGKWEVDTEKSIKLAEKAEADQSRIDQIEQMGSMTIEFVDDGGLLINMQQFELEGDWEVDSVEVKDKVKQGVLATEVVGPDGSSQSLNLNVVVRGKGEIKIWPDNEDESEAIVMKRAKEEKKDKKEKDKTDK